MRLSGVQAALTLALLRSACFGQLQNNSVDNLLVDGWVPFGASFYKLGATNSTWEDAAQTGCTQMHEKAYLTSMHSLEEHQFIVDQFTANVIHIWIGLNDITKEGHFSWVNGDALDFTYWASAEPNDKGDNEDCGDLWSGEEFQWNDYVCEYSLPFICKLDASDTLN